MIRRIKIDGYKSFKSLEVQLQPLSVVFGPNASGKSNLLDAIYLLAGFVTKRNLKEAFQGHRGLPLESFYYGDEGYEKLLDRPSIQLAFEVDVELSAATRQKVREIVRAKRKGFDAQDSDREVISERFLRYRLEIEGLPQTGHLRVVSERLTALRQDGKEKKTRNAFVESRAGVDGGRVYLRMEGQAHPTYHQLGLDYTVVSMALYEPHYPHITAFRTELAGWRVFYLEPRKLMREDVPIAQITTLGPRGENLAAFLNFLQHNNPKAYESLNLTLRCILPMKAQTEITRSKEGLVSLRISENDVWYSARLLSEGTIRLLGLLAAIHPANEATLVAFEEPENGVHPVRLKVIAELLKNAAQNTGGQLIVTTHSPILVEYFKNEDLFYSQKENHASVVKPFSSVGSLYRRSEIDQRLEDAILRGDFGG